MLICLPALGAPERPACARILAKALNCAEGPTPHPCNHRENCREITEGTSGDVIEIDAASNRGIDEIRKSGTGLFCTGFQPVYKVYIID